MSEPKKRGSNWPAWLMMGCVVLPLLYVLSAGPTFYFILEGKLDPLVFRVYHPIQSVCQYCPPLGYAFEQYVYSIAPRGHKLGFSPVYFAYRIRSP